MEGRGSSASSAQLLSRAFLGKSEEEGRIDSERGHWGTAEGENNYSQQGEQNLPASCWKQRDPCSPLPHPQSTGVCAPFLRDAVWSPNLRVGQRLCAPKRRSLAPHHCPAFLCSHHRAPKSLAACPCRLGLQKDPVPASQHH